MTNMLQRFPKQIASKGIMVYLIALMVVSAVFNGYAMKFVFMAFGIIEVIGFFAGSTILSRKWAGASSRQYESHLFWLALIIRIAWVVFSYLFFISFTGQPFEPGAADSLGYHDTATWLKGREFKFVFSYLFQRGSVSDSGYVFYLTMVYKICGNGVIVPRIFKSVMSAFSTVLIYKMVARSVDEETGRLAGAFAMLMPNLIIYCGLHLKETEMLFLLCAFLERTDYLIRTREYSMGTILLPLILCASLFTFRTVLGAVAFFSLCTGLLFTSTRVVGLVKKVLVVFWILLAAAVLTGGAISSDIERYYVERTENQVHKRSEQTSRGNLWAQYATGAVMAPMMFVLPFSTMVDVDEQYTQQILHGGNLVRNYMGYFVLVALFVAFFRRKDWRNYLLIGTYSIGYLAILSLSGFANSERFLLPALPGLIFLWAYGVRVLDKHSYRYFSYWVYVVFFMQVAWAYFKLGSRGLF